MPFTIVSIEGNIGSGKSTLLDHLKLHYKNDPRIVFAPEPVSEWEKIKDKEGVTMLEKFYADQEKFFNKIKVLLNGYFHLFSNCFYKIVIL